MLPALILPAAAPANLASEVQPGQRLADSLQSGQGQCSDLSADDFELIGEYVMGRHLASTEAHAAMNRHMALMMGRAGEQRMHVALGYRFGGCSGGPASGWVGAMGSMMSGRYGGPGGGFGSGMMGAGRHGDSDMGVLGVALIALAAAALGGGFVALARHRRRPSRDRAA